MSIVCSTSNLNNMDKGTPTNYQLVFPLIPGENSIGANNPFIMNIHTTMLPSITLANEEHRWQGNKTKRGMIPMEYDPWMVSFTVDSLLYNWKLLFDWMSYINNNNDKISEYHGEYSVDCSLVVTNNYGYAVLEVIFVGIWPSTMGEVSFSQREGDVLLESTINFNYDYFYVRDTAWSIEFSSSSQSSSSKSWASSSSESSSSISSSSSSSVSSSSVSSSSSTSTTITTVSGPVAGGDAITYSPDVGGANGRFLIADASTVRYSDDLGQTWTTYVNPSGTMFNVKWLPQISQFVATFDNASGDRLGFSDDGLKWNMTNSISTSYYLSRSNIEYSERTNLIWVVSNTGGSSTRIHTCSGGPAYILNANVDTVGLYNYSEGGCSTGQEDYFFSKNYKSATNCIAPDTNLTSWGGIPNNPFSQVLNFGGNTTPARSRLLGDGNGGLAYSGCYNPNPQVSAWDCNNGAPVSAASTDGFWWSKGKYAYGYYWVIGNDDTLRRSVDGDLFQELTDTSSLTNITSDCVIAKIGNTTTIITIGSYNVACLITTITEG